MKHEDISGTSSDTPWASVVCQGEGSIFVGADGVALRSMDGITWEPVLPVQPGGARAFLSQGGFVDIPSPQAVAEQVKWNLGRPERWREWEPEFFRGPK